MFGKLLTIHKLKKLKRAEVDKAYLASFRRDLLSHMERHPAAVKPGFWPGISIYRHGAMPVAVSVLAIGLAGASAALASRSSLPDDVLYPVKIATEKVRLSFVADETEKAKLHARYAEKRAEEVKLMLAEESREDAAGFERAIESMKEHASESAEIISQGRMRGDDVENVAKEAQGRIESAKSGLVEEMGKAEVRVRDEAKKEVLKKEVEKAKVKIEESEDRIGKSEIFKKEAEAAIAAAKLRFEQAKAEGTASSTRIRKYSEFIDKASSSISGERWVQARQHARQAESFLEKDSSNGKKNKEVEKNRDSSDYPGKGRDDNKAEDDNRADKNGTDRSDKPARGE